MGCYFLLVGRKARDITKRSRGARGIRAVCVFEKSGGWWVAEFPPFPGAYSQGRTKDEAYRNLLSAMRDLVEAYARIIAKEGKTPRLQGSASS
jgi:predicted RNase H-like HicB family nuclease